MGWRCANTKKTGGPCNYISMFPQLPATAICPRCKQKPTWVAEAHPDKYNSSPLDAAPDVANAGDRAEIAAKRVALKGLMDMDPVAVAVRAIIAADHDLSTDRKLNSNFELFRFLYHARDYLAPKLKASESFREALKHEFDTDEVLEPDHLILLDGAIAEILAQGWALFCLRWGTLTTTPNKRKLISDAFDSPKGYPKTARALEAWQPPGDVEALQLFRDWLAEHRNDSIYTGAPIRTDEREKLGRIHPPEIADALLEKVGPSRTIGQQIKRWYDMECKTPGRYAHMWGLLFQKIHDALGMSRTDANHMALLQKYCTDHTIDMTTAFVGLVSPPEIRELVVTRFAYVYHHQFPNVR